MANFFNRSNNRFKIHVGFRNFGLAYERYVLMIGKTEERQIPLGEGMLEEFFRCIKLAGGDNS